MSIEYNTQTTKCNICKAIIKVTSPSELTEVHSWIGSIIKRHERVLELWYCTRHSMREILNFEGEL